VNKVSHKEFRTTMTLVVLAMSLIPKGREWYLQRQPGMS
jgi:hypothetical protein